MGKLVFVPYSAQGHVNPLLPVLSAVVARGEDVRVVIDREFASVIAATGASPVVLPHHVEVHVPEGWNRKRAVGWGRRRRQRRQTAAFLVAELRRSVPDLVVADSHLGWVNRIARERDVPTVQFSTTYATNEHVVRERSGLRVPLSVVRWLHPAARRFHRHRGLVLVNALPSLQPAERTFSGRVRFVGPLSALRTEGEADLPWDRIRRGPTLLVSPGTVFARRPGFFRAIAREFADTDWTVVFATGHTDPLSLGSLPSNVIVRRAVPQLALLGHTTVFLTHGGMNSALEALTAGVPMVLSPRSGEQKTVAKMVIDLGAGLPLPVGGVRRLVETLAADQRIRRALDGLVTSFADPAGVAADLLVDQVRTQVVRKGRRTWT